MRRCQVRRGRGLPFDDVAFIFAEHFIEHLDFHSGLEFLRDCRRALSAEGVLDADAATRRRLCDVSTDAAICSLNLSSVG